MARGLSRLITVTRLIFAARRNVGNGKKARVRTKRQDCFENALFKQRVFGAVFCFSYISPSPESGVARFITHPQGVS